MSRSSSLFRKRCNGHHRAAPVEPLSARIFRRRIELGYSFYELAAATGVLACTIRRPNPASPLTSASYRRLQLHSTCLFAGSCAETIAVRNAHAFRRERHALLSSVGANPPRSRRFGADAAVIRTSSATTVPRRGSGCSPRSRTPARSEGRKANSETNAVRFSPNGIRTRPSGSRQVPGGTGECRNGAVFRAITSRRASPNPVTFRCVC